MYKNILKACLSSPNCKNFETWGFTDKYSWLPAPENGLPFDRNMQPKLAFDEMYDTLKNWPRDSEAVV